MGEQDRDLPEGVINADPAGGWESAATADGETDKRSDLAKDASVTDGWTSGIPQAENAAGRGSADAGRGGTDVGEVESDEPSQGADPDLATDADTAEEE